MGKVYTIPTSHGENPVLNVEIWTDIPDMPYEISPQGMVRRKRSESYVHKDVNHIRPYDNKGGYSCVHLYKQGKMYSFLVHRLLAQAFIPNPEGHNTINHIDGNPKNNSLDNLEWCDHSHNMQHAWRTGLVKNRHGNASNKRTGSSSSFKGVSWSAQRQKWCACIGYNSKTIPLGRFKDEVEAAKAYDTYVRENDLERLGYSTNFN